ncbi:MAG TPA: hypothetical protein ENI69_10980 [Rhodospirillales bacterium]|nr:hypothetical protein [Rhodospirillales bacterium]
MKRFFVAIVLTLSVSACASDRQANPVAEPLRHFSYNQAVAAIAEGKAASQKGDHAQAIAALQTGLILWPAHQPGWAALSVAYQNSGDSQGANYAGYFAERIEWANSLHGRTAAAAFDNIALIDKEKPYADRRIVQTATLLSAFYRQGEARIRGVQAAQLEARKTFGQRYLIYPVAIVSGGVVVYQLIKAAGYQ